eukprot:TRINITY_DN28214_c0_g1_i1.p1 TRINITY_DN28214_c0_g1~~TRINITY_DN28214_c0_g1_i1.p1  ORF type:complete len:359 (+),score=17.29 TRINITY_DN28214_c0_g1_i1:36-1079(+)
MGDSSSDDSFQEDNYIPYGQRKEWKNVTPIPQGDGPEPVVPIEYTEEFVDTMNYFRAVVHAHETSERAFELCDAVVTLNPANYVAWYYRRQIIYELNMDIRSELERMRDHVTGCPKNYQVWYHRRELLERLPNAMESATAAEKKLIDEVLAEDPKNYHAWSHRRWLVKTFKFWDGEFQLCDKMLQDDVRNNSAWNFRYFLFECSRLPECQDLDADAAARLAEIAYAQDQAKKAVNNESPYNYMFGLLPKGNNVSLLSCLGSIVPFLETIGKSNPECIQSRSTLLLCHIRLSEVPDTLAPADATFLHEKEYHWKQCSQLAKELMELDQIRYKYWNYQSVYYEDLLAAV